MRAGPWIGALLVGLGALLGGCATVPQDRAARAEFEANHDPLEPMNRKIFAFNQVVDKVLIKPLAKGYVKVLPEWTRDGFRHFLDNLNEPIVFANALMQGRLKAAGVTGARFLINSSVGFAGVSEVAARQPDGLPKQLADFGQTLHVWGAAEGPYLIVPVIGPMNPRDGVGTVVDIYIDPFRYVLKDQGAPTYVQVGRSFFDGIDKRARSLEALDEMQHEAIDYYASFRSFFRQYRSAQLRSGDLTPASPKTSPDFYEDPGR